MRYLGILLLILALGGCQSHCLNKEAMLDNFQTFVVEVETKYKETPVDSWKSMDQRYKSYIDDCYAKYKKEMSVSERVNFLKNAVSYRLYHTYQDKEYHDPSSLSLQTEMDDLGQRGRAELEKLIRTELKPSLESAIDEVVNEVEKIGDQLKDWLNKQ